MSRYLTRPAERRDEPFLYACYRETMRDYITQTWGWDEEFQKSSFAEHLPWQRFQIIMVDARIVGGACLTETPIAIELEMIIIAPQAQRAGIGSDFVANLLRRAREDGRRVRLRVLKVNPAKALYERLGFVVIGEDAATFEMSAEP